MSLALQQLRSAGVQLLASSDSGAIPGHGVKTIWASPFQLEPFRVKRMVYDENKSSSLLHLDTFDTVLADWRALEWRISLTAAEK